MDLERLRHSSTSSSSPMVLALPLFASFSSSAPSNSLARAGASDPRLDILVGVGSLDLRLDLLAGGGPSKLDLDIYKKRVY